MKNLRQEKNKNETLIQVSYLLQKGEFEKSEKIIRKLVKEFPNNLVYKNLLAIIYAGQKKFNNSISVLNSIVKKDPSFVEAYINFGNVYLDVGQLKKSENLLLLRKHLLSKME